MSRLPVLLLLVLFFAGPAHAQRGPVPGLSTATPYLIYYGNWTTTDAEFARDNYKLVVLHPSVSNVTPAQIALIQSGPDQAAGTSDDVPVLAYISVGEDDRPGVPFTGDGSGPRVDPRGSDSEPLTGIDPLGDPSPGGVGFASFYLDDGVIGDPNSVANDGQPDRNATFGGYYVNPGDPAWFPILKTKTKAATGRAGMDELLTSTTGVGYNCDGLFLDTLDTPAPNSFGATQFEWTTPGYQSLVAQISATYPSDLLLGNRGLFFYNPNLKNYGFTLRPYLDLVLFESYYSDSSANPAPTAFFEDNKFNFAPKINAEAQRPDGFTMLSLGYTKPGEPVTAADDDFWESQGEQGWLLYRTNPALNALPFSTEATAWNGIFLPDPLPPVWDSTGAIGIDSDPGTPGNQPPPPRVGIQEAVAGNGEVTVRWDVARDQVGPVRYNLYFTDEASLDFNTATKITHVQPEIPVAYLSGAGPGRFPFEHTVTGLVNGTTYRFAVRAEDSASPPNEDENTVVLAATPGAPLSTFATITIDGDASDWAGVPVALSDPLGDGTQDILTLKVANDADYLYVLVEYNGAVDTNTFNGSPSIFLSLDNDATPATGFDIFGLGLVGSEVSWQNDFAFAQDAANFNLNDAFPGVTFTNGIPGIAPYFGTTAVQEYRLSRDATYSVNAGPDQPVFPGDTIALAMWTNHPVIAEFAGPAPYTFAAAPPTPSHFAFIDVDGGTSDWDTIPVAISDPLGDGTQDILSLKLANDDDYLYLLVAFNGNVNTNTLGGSPSIFLSLDNDADPATGFDIFGFGSIGAEVSWQNDFAFAQDAANFNLNDAFPGVTFTNGIPGISPYFSNTAVQEYRLRRDATYSVNAGPDQAVFPEDTIAVAMWTDGGNSEFAGSPLYAFAANPGNTAYETWKLANFTVAELADPLASGDLADLDRDGIPTLLEFALGLDPRTPDRDGLPIGSLVTVGPDRFLAITYSRRPPADGVTYTVESSSTLTAWDASQAQFIEVSATPLPNGLEEVTVRLNVALPGGPSYLRLRVELN